MKKDLSLKKIGFISKLNGFKGELVLATNEDNLFDEQFMFVMIDGIQVPFFVEDIFEKGGNVIVKFEDVYDEPKALQLVKHEVFIEQKKGKKRMRQFGKVEVPQEAFISVLKLND